MGKKHEAKSIVFPITQEGIVNIGFGCRRPVFNEEELILDS